MPDTKITITDYLSLIVFVSSAILKRNDGQLTPFLLFFCVALFLPDFFLLQQNNLLQENAASIECNNYLASKF